MTKIIKNKIILSAILFVNIFSISVYAVERKYIPNTTDAVISFSFDNLSKKAEGDLQQILNSLFMQRLANKFLETRDDEVVAEAMTNRLAQLFDFSKDSKIIFINDYGKLTLIVDILDITELDKIMIKIASQEDKLISFSESANYRYLSLDENTLISWNNEIFTVSLRGLFFEDNDNIIDSAENIFKGVALENEYFISLENETNDCYVWMDLSFLSENEGSLFELLLELAGDMPESVKDIYKDGVLTGKINFGNGNADMVFDTYIPNNTYDFASLKKQLSENIFKFVNGQNNYGFLSLAFNNSALSKILGNMNYISLLFDEETSAKLEREGIDASKLYELLGGDIFVSGWNTEDDKTVLLFSISITDEETGKKVLDTLSDSKEGDIYIIGGDYFYIRDSILYTVNEKSVIDSIARGEIPNIKLDENKLKLARENIFSSYLELTPFIGDLLGEENEEFESIYLTSNILDNKHSQTIIKLEAKDKTKNILTIIKSFFIESDNN
ncbi:DUF4836 domain-containing protein [Brachyspira catarrhinii]|uniref:DUF4836 domain-containing protein n=1 Tax=Brachyspira catarrhinii TaxID=2528966 RepID=UPI001F19060E|nr:DUF4836 domain-containing protein [Brachyspira catarrhinii]